MEKSVRVSSNIDKNIKWLKNAFENCFDITLRQLKNIEGRDVLIVFSDGLADKEMIEQSIISPLLGFALTVEGLKLKNLDEISERLLTSVQIATEPDISAAVTSCLSGDTLVFIAGCAEALVIQTRKWQFRGISQPETQRTVRGSREGFTETLLFNVAMLRRRIKSPELKTEMLRVGGTSKTDVCLCYLKGAASEKLLTLLRRRIADADVSYILESGHVEQLIEDGAKTIFSTTGNNEKPDVVAAKLMKGRAALIVDGTPFVLTAPLLFSENFQSPEDYYSRPFYANFLRVLRFIAWLLTITLPSLYVALVTFHREMIPDKLLSTLILSGEGAPMSIGMEVFLLLIVYELLREAMLRLPSSVGGSVGLVGVLIIGEAAVGVKLIGAPTVVVCAVAFIASAVVTPLSDSSALLRFGLLLLAAFFGAYGVFLGLFVMLARLCSLSSYGCPYMLPIAPVSVKGIKTSVLRLNIRDILRGGGCP